MSNDVYYLCRHLRAKLRLRFLQSKSTFQTPEPERKKKECITLKK